MILDAKGQPVQVEPIPDALPVDPYEARMLEGARLMQYAAEQGWPMSYAHDEDDELEGEG